MEPGHTGVCLRECVKELQDSGKELEDGKLKAWQYVRELKLDVQEAEVRQILLRSYNTI